MTVFSGAKNQEHSLYLVNYLRALFIYDLNTSNKWTAEVICRMDISSMGLCLNIDDSLDFMVGLRLSIKRNIGRWSNI